MIKMLIVDDEVIVRKGIRNSIDWNKYDVDILDEASNGVVALEKMEDCLPDIILTDIRMPLMDGLELSRKIKQKHPQIKIVILSGYEEFQYAKQAISVGVNEYLLKPISEDVLISLILRLKEQIEAEAIEKERIAQSKGLLNQNLIYIKEKLIQKIIKGEFHDRNQILHEAKRIRYDLKGTSFSVFAIQIDDIYKRFSSLSEADRKIQEFSVYNVAEETLLDSSSGIIAFGEDVTLVGIITSNYNGGKDFHKTFSAILKNVNTFLGISISIGVGNSCDEVGEISKSYEEALHALKKRFYSGKNSLVFYSKVQHSEKNGIYDISLSEEKEFNNMFRNLDYDGLKQKMERLFEDFKQIQVEERIVKNISCRIITGIFACAKEMGLYRKDWQGTIANAYAVVDRMEYIESIYEWLLNNGINLLNEISGNKSRKYNSIVRSALRYMENNYEKNITLADISAITYVSPNYLSTVFKEEVGVNFVDWLNQLRIEKAVQYLKETNFKVYEIAEKVGFTDYKYFCYIFKKFQKCTPTQYRELR